MAIVTAGLSTHVWNNNFRSMLLLASYPVIVFAIVWLIVFSMEWLMEYDTGPDAVHYGTRMANSVIFEYWPMIIGGVMTWFVIAWLSHSSMIRGLSHSRPVTRKEEPELYNLLENLCISQGVDMPGLEIIESHARNAFASGIDKNSYSITVTRGLLNSLKKDEIEAVLGHELTHIMNRDVRLLIISIIFTGMIGILSQMAWNLLRHSYYVPRRRSKDSGSSILLIFVIALILSIGYAATLITRFAISRGREYMADAGSIEMTKNPDAMMRALLRISKRDRVPGTTEDIAMMHTHNSKLFMGIFATHPPIEERIKTISELTNTPIPEIKAIPVASNEVFGEADRSEGPWHRNGKR